MKKRDQFVQKSTVKPKTNQLHQIAKWLNGADLGQSFLCEKGTDRGFPDSYVKIMYQRFLITLPSAYIHDESNDLNAR